jgi:hypothetical protein
VTWVMWNLSSFRLETVLVSVQDMCMVCVERTIGSNIILAAPNGTPRDMGHVESLFFLFGDSVSVGVR